MKTILSHSAIILSIMYLVFFCIDRVNTAMGFIANDITKVLILILCFISTVNSCMLISGERRKVRRRREQLNKRRAQQTKFN